MIAIIIICLVIWFLAACAASGPKLVKCPCCSKDVSQQAFCCVQCGHPIAKKA